MNWIMTLNNLDYESNYQYKFEIEFDFELECSGMNRNEMDYKLELFGL